MSATATSEVEQPRTARDAVKAGGFISGSPAIDHHAPRFFVQMGWTVLGVDTPAIPNSYLLRGEITPCQSFQQKDALMAIPEGMLISGSEQTDRDGRTVYGSYWKYAHFEANRLNELEASKELKDGLVEIRALAEFPRLYQQVNLNTLFFPDGLDKIPAKNVDAVEYLRNRVTQLALIEESEMPGWAKEIVLKVGAELIAATEATEKLQQERIAWTHKCMKEPLSEPMHKRGYDLVDEEMMIRTGIPRLHEGELKTAQALELLAKDRARGADEAAIQAAEMQRQQFELQRSQMEMMKQQMAQQALLIERLMGSLPVAATEDAVRPAQTKAPKSQPKPTETV